MSEPAVAANATETLVKYEVFRASVPETQRVSDYYRTAGQAEEWLDVEMHTPQGAVLKRNEKPVTGKIEQLVVALDPETVEKRNFRLAAKDAKVGVLKSTAYTQVQIPTLDGDVFLAKARPLNGKIHQAHLRRMVRLEEIRKRKELEEEDRRVLSGQA